MMTNICESAEPTLLELAEQNLKRLMQEYEEGKLNKTEKDFFLGHSPSIMRGIEALYRIKYRESDLDLKKDKSQKTGGIDHSAERDEKIVDHFIEEQKKLEEEQKKQDDRKARSGESPHTDSI